MVEAQAAESSRKGGLVCRTHASIRAVLAGRMGPGERERHGAAPDGFLASRTRTVGKSKGNALPKGRAGVGVLSSDLVARAPAAAREASADASLGPEKALQTWGEGQLAACMTLGMPSNSSLCVSGADRRRAKHSSKNYASTIH